jgi:D-tyrosyl-tRNA(Tyr) deacylase
MKAVIQRVSKASVEIKNKIIGEIGNGFVILLGIRNDDEKKDAEYLAKKIAYMRIFEDKQEKMNISLLEKGAEALVISQFTLYSNTRKGRRPSFIEAAKPEVAIPLYNYFIHSLENEGISVKKGEFGAMMLVKIFNQGPVTIILDSEDRLKPRGK